jgi:hypothetical protein
MKIQTWQLIAIGIATACGVMLLAAYWRPLGSNTPAASPAPAAPRAINLEEHASKARKANQDMRDTPFQDPGPPAPMR